MTSTCRRTEADAEVNSIRGSLIIISFYKIYKLVKPKKGVRLTCPACPKSNGICMSSSGAALFRRRRCLRREGWLGAKAGGYLALTAARNLTAPLSLAGLLSSGSASGRGHSVAWPDSRVGQPAKGSLAGSLPHKPASAPIVLSDRGSDMMGRGRAVDLFPMLRCWRGGSKSRSVGASRNIPRCCRLVNLLGDCINEAIEDCVSGTHRPRSSHTHRSGTVVLRVMQVETRSSELETWKLHKTRILNCM